MQFFDSPNVAVFYLSAEFINALESADSREMKWRVGKVFNVGTRSEKGASLSNTSRFRINLQIFDNRSKNCECQF
jgi:hypothetical protein